jgi:hydroxyethylthiazole kinase
MLKQCTEIWELVDKKRPLVHCITNYVTVNDVANILLSAGASPAMIDHPEEAEGFAALASALYVNLGTLSQQQQAGIMVACKTTAANNIPVILDPVACGVVPFRVQVMKQMRQYAPLTLIKGNTAEIKSLAGEETRAQGVDSLDSSEGMEQICMNLARQESTIIASTGPTDVITDGRRCALVKNGTPLFEKITGAGCMVGGVTAACIGAAPEEPWLATITGLLAFTLAGERAAADADNRPGAFHLHLFDHLYTLKKEDLLKEARVEWL